jgi:membrane fusion protein, cation efflux system
MRPFPFMSTILAVSLLMSVSSTVLAHVGHGDEFQSKGGINRVEVKTETDSLMGIVVNPIASSADGSPGVMIPATALVDADGKPLVFVQYENFYEPVPITTGATKGDLIEVTQGLSVGEKLVTQGSLSLYAESRKTQTASASPSPSSIPSPSTIASSQTASTHAQADAQGVPHSHDASGNMAHDHSGIPVKLLAAVGGGTVLLGGAIAAMVGARKNKKNGGY